MNFSQRLLVLSAVPTAVLVVAALVGVVALRATEARFADVFERDQPLAQAVTEMYGHGLQSGQALRNIILDPSNPTAYKNLDAALKLYDEAAALAAPLAVGTPAQGLLEKVAGSRTRQQAARERVLALVKTDTAGAVALLNKEETPAWREMRTGLLEAGEVARAGLQATRDGALADTRRAVFGALAATLLGTLLAVVFPVLMRRVLVNTLGGEPEAARDLVQAVAAGDLTREVPLRAGDTSSLLAHLSAMQAALAHTIHDLGVAATQVSLASREIATGNADLSSRTEQQASSLQQTAASMEQMAAQLRQSADAARQASQLAADASAVALKGGQVVGEVVTTMDAISASSRQIAEIIGVIDGIAFQTNILALNAAVEAARAGEQGRGFAVVAGEVRTLAQRSAQAAREIKGLITQSVDKVGLGNRLVSDAGSTMHEIVTQVQHVTALINDITAGTLEESTGIGQVNQAVAHLDQMTQQNAALVEESAAAAESLREQAARLQGAVSAFKLNASAAAQPG
ncbi:MAG: methyl-accepting chemotaxis protein [Rubrivivax sp.]|nr:methyl-accepting chemotaxis protein [Rubrivivax sp.]